MGTLFRPSKGICFRKKELWKRGKKVFMHAETLARDHGLALS